MLKYPHDIIALSTVSFEHAGVDLLITDISLQLQKKNNFNTNR